MDYSQYFYVPPEDFIYKPNKKIMSISPKRYRLKKDINSPSLQAKAGAIGELTCVDQVWFNNNSFYFHISTVEENTEWFEEVGEKFQVIGVNKPKHSYGFYIDYIMRVTQEIPSEKIPAIKEAIERVLNNEMVFEFIPINVKYTKDQLIEAERKAFYAGRRFAYQTSIEHNIFYHDTKFPKSPAKYVDFEDYKKHNP